ncbi:MAG: hypothetical protein ABH871_03730 [Pseudomonadota bacterium]
MQARAADDEPDPGLSSPFTLIILGTRSASDIELIRKNIKSLAYIKGFSPSQVSQRHLEFTGSFVGSEETFLADIESLSADRFEVNSKDDRERGLVVTLRKIQPVPVE